MTDAQIKVSGIYDWITLPPHIGADGRHWHVSIAGGVISIRAMTIEGARKAFGLALRDVPRANLIVSRWDGWDYTNADFLRACDLAVDAGLTITKPTWPTRSPT